MSCKSNRNFIFQAGSISGNNYFSVYANGNSRTPYKFLLKSPRSQNLDHILDDVAIKISKKTGAAIRHMYTTEVCNSLDVCGQTVEGLRTVCGHPDGPVMMLTLGQKNS